MTIYVGNIPFGLKEEELQALFEDHGKVSSVKIIRDKVTGKSKGFGFVDMASSEEGANAVSKLNGTDMNGRPLKVTEARPRE